MEFGAPSIGMGPPTFGVGFPCLEIPFWIDMFKEDSKPCDIDSED